MTATECDTLMTDPSTFVLSSNSTYAHLCCRAGYKLIKGDSFRSCDPNGTWTGHPLVCTVDSILPKSYLVILIVGATIAVFVACIPYDFYRFRKRKKKVRDHQERLSLVTRIAPGHAKIVTETVPSDLNKPSPSNPRRFGLKSLFSVFRFVGAKMKMSESSIAVGSHDNHVSPDCKSITEDRQETNVDGEGEGGASASSSSAFGFSHHHSNSCPAASDDNVFDIETVSDSSHKKPGDKIRSILVKKRPTAQTQSSRESNVSSDSTPDFCVEANTSGGGGGGGGGKRNQSLLGSRTNTDVHTQQLGVQDIEGGKTSRIPSADDSLMSEPATVEVMSINEMTSSGTDGQRSSPPENHQLPLMISPGSSASSPNVACSRRSEQNKLRTLHSPNGNSNSNVVYHSMPAIPDML